MLPGAHAVLFVNNADPGGEGIIEVQPLPAGPRKNLIPAGAYGRYLPSGHLVYLHRGTLYAVPLDVRRLELTGQPAPVLEDVSFVTGTGAAGFTFSQSGIFAYAASDPEDQLRPLGMLDESGKLELLPVARARYVRARLSPDGKRLAVVIATSGTNIWIYESISRQFSRLPFASGNANNPVWAPDGKYLVFSSDAQTPGPGIFWMRADGAGEPRRLVEGPGLVPTSFSARAGLVYQAPEGPNGGLWRLPMEWNDGAQPKPGVAERFPQPFLESPAAFSPDGRWFAYVNGQVGQPEVFVRPFPGAGGPWQISSGGTSPVWSPTRREWFYRHITNFQIRLPAIRLSTIPCTGKTSRLGRPARGPLRLNARWKARSGSPRRRPERDDPRDLLLTSWTICASPARRQMISAPTVLPTLLHCVTHSTPTVLHVGQS